MPLTLKEKLELDSLDSEFGTTKSEDKELLELESEFGNINNDKDPEKVINIASKLDLSTQEVEDNYDEMSYITAGDEPGVVKKIFEKYIREPITEHTGLFAPDIHYRESSDKKYREEEMLKTIAGATAHYGAKYASGRGLYLPDLAAKWIGKKYFDGDTVAPNTLAELVDEFTDFQPTPKEEEAGQVVGFIGAVKTLTSPVTAMIGTIPARNALKLILSSGIIFATEDTAKQVVESVNTGKEINWEGVHFKAGLGVLWGTGQVAVSAVFSKMFPRMKEVYDVGSVNEKAQVRKDISTAREYYKKHGEMPQDLMEKYVYAKSSPKASKTPIVKDFGKNPVVISETGKFIKPTTTVATIKPKATKPAEGIVTAPTTQKGLEAKQGVEGKAVVSKKTGMTNHKSAGFVDLTPLSKAGIQARTTLEATGKSLTRFTGLSPEVHQTLIEFEEEMKNIPYVARDIAIEKYGKITPKEEKLVEDFIELGEKTPNQFKDMPKELKKIADEIIEINQAVSGTLSEIGYNVDWPNSQIKFLENKLEKLGELEVPDIEQEFAIGKALEQLENVRYLHHTYNKQSFEGVKKVKQALTQKITKRPSGLLGRKYPTYLEAEQQGLKRSSLATSYADMMESVSRAVESDRLIKAINENPNLSMWSKEAPSDWVTVDENMFPASVSRHVDAKSGKVIKKTRKYPLPLAEALKELTYTSDDPSLVRVYDEINLVLKQIGFYNPLIMSKNDMFQMWRVAGIKGSVKMPQAVKIFAEKGAEYNKLRKGGLFNNAVNHTETAKALTEHMMMTIRETSGEKVARIAGEHLRLKTWVKDLTKFNEVTTWNLDQIIRISTYKALENSKMMKGMTDFEKIEFANDALVNYAKLPKATKKHLNRVVFTPSYRVGNFRFLWGQLAKHPWRFKGPILRTVGYKMFIKYGLPAMVSAIVYSKAKDMQVKSEMGYKISVYNPETNTDTIYSLSDPLLEGAKITQRPVRQTVENNLAALPAAALRYFNGPKRRSTDDPVGEFFKLGTPIYRDIQLWKSKDKTTAQKILTQFAIAYVYKRQHKEPVDDNAVEALSKALSIWTDWRMQAEDVKRMYKGKSAYFGAGGEFDRLIREYKLENDELENEVDMHIEKLFRAGKDKEAIEYAMNSDRYKTTEGISGRYLRSHAPLAYYWKEFPTEDKAKFILWLKDKGYNVDLKNLKDGKVSDMNKEIEKQLLNLEKATKKVLE